MNTKYPDYTFAHVGLNVENREAAEQWYEKNLEMSTVRSTPGAMSFLADPTGRVILEIYSNDSVPRLDFHNTHALALHIALLVDDPKASEKKLLAVGAVTVDPYRVKESGDEMIMMKDPFGLGLQLIKRKSPMF